MHRYRDRDWEDRGSWRGREEEDFNRGRDFGWRGTELDRGFPRRDSGYDRGYDRPYDRGYDNRDFTNRGYEDRNRDSDRYRDSDRDRYRFDDRYRYRSGDPYFDRGYDRPRDDARDRDIRFRDREYGRDRDYWDDYPWSRYGR